MKPGWIALLSVVLAASATAATFIPASDSTVVTTLPASKNPLARQLRQLQRQQAASPHDAELTARLARTYIETSRRLADPRYLGHAEAVLQPWLNRPDAPASIWLLAGIIQQSQHHFVQSLQSLQRASVIDPHDAQTWLTLASVHQVRGEFDAARGACRRLITLLGPAETSDCLAGVDALTGRADESIAHWRQRLASNQVEDWAEPWLLGQLAETAQRLGRYNDAGQWFQQALQRNSDAYTKAAYADFLLQLGQPDKVVDLLAGDEQVDPLLLRLAEARHALQQPQAKELIQQLQQRFDAARARNDATHQREEARFQLRLLGNPVKAVQLAQANWQIQKEPADARILLQAAFAARQPAAAQPVIKWLSGSGLEDNDSWALARQL